MANKADETTRNQNNLVDLSQATDLVQAMEARGDFKFKGIFRVFEIIETWTERFSANGILPTMEQISRDVQLSPEKTREYLRELLGLGSSKAKMIVAMPSVDFVSSPEPDLLKMVVYCRPMQNEGTSLSRYLKAYEDKNYKAVQKWSESRPAKTTGFLQSELIPLISEGKLPESHAAAEISKLFTIFWDESAEQKKESYRVYVKPLVQKLIDGGQIYLLPKEGESPYKATLFNHSQELENRFHVLGGAAASRILHKQVDLPGEADEFVKELKAFNPGGLSIGEKQLYYEILILAPALNKIRTDAAVKEKKKSFDKILSDIASANGLLPANRLGNLPIESTNSIRADHNILSLDYPLGGQVALFLLHKNNITKAVKNAREAFDKNGNDGELRILSEMNVARFLDADWAKAFEDLEHRVFFQQLSWFVRIWRLLFGQLKLKADELAKIKNQQKKQLEADKLKAQTAQAKEAQRRLVEERMKDGSSKEAKDSKDSGDSRNTRDAKESAARSSPSSKPQETADKDKPTVNADAAAAEEAIKAEERLKAIVQALDKAWDEKRLPNRTFLLEQFPDMTEDSLVMFLKKWAKKEIYSYRIENAKPEYVWPIMISRRYLKSNGKRMLNDAMAEADAQRNASMPNQEKFDVATSLEDFLNRTLPKLP